MTIFFTIRKSLNNKVLRIKSLSVFLKGFLFIPIQHFKQFYFYCFFQVFEEFFGTQIKTIEWTVFLTQSFYKTLLIFKESKG